MIVYHYKKKYFHTLHKNENRLEIINIYRKMRNDRLTFSNFPSKIHVGCKSQRLPVCVKDKGQLLI